MAVKPRMIPPGPAPSADIGDPGGVLICPPVTETSAPLAVAITV